VRLAQPVGEEQFVALIQESLAVANKTGAVATKDLERIDVYNGAAQDDRASARCSAHPSGARETGRH